MLGVDDREERRPKSVLVLTLSVRALYEMRVENAHVARGQSSIVEVEDFSKREIKTVLNKIMFQVLFPTLMFNFFSLIFHQLMHTGHHMAVKYIRHSCRKG